MNYSLSFGPMTNLITDIERELEYAKIVADTFLFFFMWEPQLNFTKCRKNGTIPESSKVCHFCVGVVIKVS